MEQENSRSFEPDAARLPTELRLFRPNRQENLQLVEKAEFTKGALAKNYLHIIEWTEDLVERRSNIERSIEERYNILFQYTSYRTASAAYLKIWDELSAKGVSKEDVNELFLKCFFINSASSFFTTPLSDRQDVERLHKTRLTDEKAGKTKSMAVAEKIASRPPAWFSGNRREWMDYVLDHAEFGHFLNPNKRIADYDIDELGYTNQDWTPDWMDKLEGENFPTREEIESELSEDTNEQNSALENLDRIGTGQERLVDYYFDHYRKSVKKGEEFRRSISPNHQGLADTVSYLYAAEDIPECVATPEEISEMDPRQIFDAVVDSDESFDTFIKKTVEGSSIPEDFFALWLEKKFKDVNLSPSSKISEETASALSLFDEQDKEELKTYRESNKKLYHLLNNDINPLIQLATDEEKDYLKELLGNVKDETLGTFIWELSYIFSRNQYKPKNDTQDKLLKDVRRVAGLWLRRNWRWAYGALRDSVGIKEEEQVIEAEIGANTIDDSEEVQIRKERSELKKQQPLSDWKIFYSTNRRVEGNGLVQITGDTVHDKEEVLDEVLLKNGQQVSIKSSSVVNALDWISTLPNEIFHMMPKMDVDGQEYTKVKRGSVRLLFKRDSDDKKIVFFLHQKKAWHYKF